MKSDGRNILSSVVSEWEDNVLFDADDPDFAKTNTNATAANLNVLNAYMLKGKFFHRFKALLSSTSPGIIGQSDVSSLNPLISTIFVGGWLSILSDSSDKLITLAKVPDTALIHKLSNILTVGIPFMYT